MHYLALHILCIVLFSQGLRWMQHRAAGLWRVVAWNYVFCAALAAGSLALPLGEPWRATLPALGLGTVVGILYVLHLHVILLSYRQVGVGITFALMSSAAAPPAVFGWLVWGEAMTAARVIALLLLPVSGMLLRPVRSGGLPRHLSLRDDLILFSTFAIASILNISHKAAALMEDGRASHPYVAALFLAAMVSSWVVVFSGEHPPQPADKRVGATIGVANLAATSFALLGLALVPAGIFYPVAACGVIMANLFIGWRLWGERIAPRQLAGAAVAVVIVVLVNL